jgi:hypothetical protein
MATVNPLSLMHAIIRGFVGSLASSAPQPGMAHLRTRLAKPKLVRCSNHERPVSRLRGVLWNSQRQGTFVTQEGLQRMADRKWRYMQASRGYNKSQHG